MNTIGLLGGMSWEPAGDELARAAAGSESSGADFLVPCTNTMHKVARQIEARVGVPLLHIAGTSGSKLQIHLGVQPEFSFRG